MSFYKLVDDIQLSGRWHLGEVVVEGDPDGDYWSFTRVDEGVGALVADLDVAGRPLDFTLSGMGVPVVSARARRAFSVAENDVEFVPLRCNGVGGEFWVLNTRRVVRCLDEGRSRFDKWPDGAETPPHLVGGYRQVPVLRLDYDLIPAGVRVFRVEGWRVALIVDEMVREALLDANVVGAKFFVV